MLLFHQNGKGKSRIELILLMIDTETSLSKKAY